MTISGFTLCKKVNVEILKYLCLYRSFFQHQRWCTLVIFYVQAQYKEQSQLKERPKIYVQIHNSYQGTMCYSSEALSQNKNTIIVENALTCTDRSLHKQYYSVSSVLRCYTVHWVLDEYRWVQLVLLGVWYTTIHKTSFSTDTAKEEMTFGFQSC